MQDWAPDDTQSFSVAAALRAPIGSTLEDEHRQDVRSGARLLLAGLGLIVLDIGVDGSSVTVDLVPDVVGGVLVVLGVLAIARVADRVGPARARSRMLTLAILQLPLLVGTTITPVDLTDAGQLAFDWLGPLQTFIACMGTAVVATVLGRAHDSLGQLSRRGRWSLARRTCLLAVIGWLPLAALAGATGPEGLHAAAAGAAGLVMIALGFITLAAVGRALAGSMSVFLPDR